MKHTTTILLFLLPALALSQRLPSGFPTKSPEATDAIYTQETGAARKVLFSDLKTWILTGVSTDAPDTSIYATVYALGDSIAGIRLEIPSLDSATWATLYALIDTATAIRDDFPVNTDAQTLGIDSSGNTRTISISGGNSISFGVGASTGGADSTIYATVYRSDTLSAAIRSEIPTNNNQLTNGAGYITGNQTITLSGDVTGSGETAITTDLADGAVDWDELSGPVQDSIQAGGGGVSGSGTANYLSKWTSPNSLGNSVVSEVSGTIQVTDPNTVSGSTRSFVVNQPNNVNTSVNSYDVFEVRSDGSIKITDRYGDDLSSTGLHINYFDRRAPAVYIGRSHSNVPYGVALAVSDHATGTHNFSGGPSAGGAFMSGTTNSNNSVKSGGIFISNYASENYTAASASTTFGSYSVGKTSSGLNTAGATKKMVGVYAAGLNSWAVDNTNSVSIGLWAKADGGQYNYAGIFESGSVGIGTTAPAYILDINGTGGARIPVGTTAQRPTNAAGVLRWNTTTTRPEIGDGSNWNTMTEESWGEMYVPASDPDTVSFSGGAGTPAKPTDLTAGELSNFTYSSGRLTYTGAVTGKFLVSASASISFSEANTTIEGWVYKDGAEVTKSEMHSRITVAGDVDSKPINCILELATNSYIEIFFAPQSHTGDDELIIEAMNVTITEL